MITLRLLSLQGLRRFSLRFNIQAPKVTAWGYTCLQMSRREERVKPMESGENAHIQTFLTGLLLAWHASVKAVCVVGMPAAGKSERPVKTVRAPSFNATFSSRVEALESQLANAVKRSSPYRPSSSRVRPHSSGGVCGSIIPTPPNSSKSSSPPQNQTLSSRSRSRSQPKGDYVPTSMIKRRPSIAFELEAANGLLKQNVPAGGFASMRLLNGQKWEDEDYGSYEELMRDEGVRTPVDWKSATTSRRSSSPTSIRSAIGTNLKTQAPSPLPNVRAPVPKSINNSFLPVPPHSRPQTTVPRSRTSSPFPPRSSAPTTLPVAISRPPSRPRAPSPSPRAGHGVSEDWTYEF
ncbi:hypothetical protein BT69DRAFT_1319092 [Atractiella rhizophila]|nr:hypothetical protein BT69DRAFT_1319092 [Atractiella rhizophila]